jgi:uncharacterized membrane protein (UPF0127 family)
MQRYLGNAQLRFLLFIALIGLGVSWLYNNTDFVQFKGLDQIEEVKLKTVTEIELDGKMLDVAVAENESERENGLMFIKSIKENQGMLFIFDYEVSASFWMKNTLIPLDMIFISKNKEVVSIQHDAQPCEKDPCTTYPSTKPFKYVVEVNAGWAKENEIEVGDKLVLTTSET